MKARKIIRRSEASYYRHDDYLFKVTKRGHFFIGRKSYKELYPNWKPTDWGLSTILESGSIKLTENEAHNQCPECFEN